MISKYSKLIKDLIAQKRYAINELLAFASKGAECHWPKGNQSNGRRICMILF